MRIVLPKRRLALLATLLTTTLSTALPAGADVGETIIQRCTHGQSLSGFSQAAYRKALQELPTEVAEYSHCDALIRRAQLAAAGLPGAGGGGSTGGGAGTSAAGTPLTATQRSTLKRSTGAGAAPVQVGNQTIHPGVVPVDIASAFSTLPTPLLAILAFLLACALALAGGAIRDRVRAHRAR